MFSSSTKCYVIVGHLAPDLTIQGNVIQKIMIQMLFMKT
jgi:hypothetical protein